MSLQNIPSRESSAPRSVSSAETLYAESWNTRYIRNGIKQMIVTADNKLVGPLAILSPAECLRFRITDRNQESEPEVLKICNASLTQKIAYKVKTTSPEFYRVRPNTGILEPDETVEIELLLRPDYDGSVYAKAYSDRFLIQIMETDNEVTSYSEVKDQWNTIDKESNSYMQNRMWCVLDYGHQDLHEIESQLDELDENLIRHQRNKQKELAQKMDEEIEATNQELMNEMLATNTELEMAKKSQHRREQRQKIIIRFAQLQICMMVMLALILFVIGYVVSKTDHVNDLANCAGNLSVGCIVPFVAC